MYCEPSVEVVAEASRQRNSINDWVVPVTAGEVDKVCEVVSSV
jgi:hypothetical protein